MVRIVVLLAYFLCLGLAARRWSGRLHLLLIAGIVGMLIFELIYLYRL